MSHSRNVSAFSTQPLCSLLRAWFFTISYCPFKTWTSACCSASIIRALPGISVHFWWPWLAHRMDQGTTSAPVRVAASRTGHGEADIPWASPGSLPLLFASNLLKNKPLHFFWTAYCQCQKFRLGLRDWLPFQLYFLPVLHVVILGELGGRQAHQGQQVAHSDADTFVNQEKKDFKNFTMSVQPHTQEWEICCPLVRDGVRDVSFSDYETGTVAVTTCISR